MHFNNVLTFGDALLLSFISILVVFAILTLISLIITLIGKVLKEEKKPAQVPTAAPVQQAQQTQQPKVDLASVVNDEHKRVALLVASIEANQNDEDKKYKITSIKEI